MEKLHTYHLHNTLRRHDKRHKYMFNQDDPILEQKYDQ